MKRESGVNPERCSHCVRELACKNHWETGKGRAAMIKVRRPAQTWNFNSAVYGLTFLQVCKHFRPFSGAERGHTIRLGRTAAETQPFFSVSWQEPTWFSRAWTTAGFVILVGGRQPACLVCLASRRPCSGKTRRPAGRSGAFFSRQRTQAGWRLSRTITQRKTGRRVLRACVPLSTDASIS